MPATRTNALPQRARANVNCRIFPGVDREEVRRKLEELAADTEVKVTTLEVRNENPPVPPLTREIMGPFEKLNAKYFPGVPIVPVLQAGATDGDSSMPSVFRPTASCPSSSGRISGTSTDSTSTSSVESLLTAGISCTNSSRATPTRSRQRVRILLTLAAALLAAPAAFAGPPRLQQQGTTQQLLVDGKPFLILGGELGNSSASSAEYMQPHWPRLKAMQLNTVLAPVYWELIEPAEGKFDWTSVDALLRDARAHELKLVFLWFGAWKNSMSTYVPSWVKRDQQRFPRVQRRRRVERGDPFGVFEDTRDADVRAFAAFMDHLKRVDGERTPCSWCRWRTRSACCPSRASAAPWPTRRSLVPCRAELMRALVARGDEARAGAARALGEERLENLRHLGTGIRR